MTQMLVETKQTPALVAKQFVANAQVMQDIATRLKKTPPKFALTIARGSSDHAATYAKYLLETHLGLVTASAAPSVQTLYDARLKLDSSLVIGISQSGKSEDICATMKMARQQNAITIAFVNNVDSPLANIAEYVVDLHAGPELAVAATKSYICSLTALCQLGAYLSADKQLINVISKLPESLDQALTMDWTELVTNYQAVNSTIIIGRGYGYPIAQESALKFKETCAIHAEPFSSAEFIHGPLALLKDNFPIFSYGQNDKSYQSVIELINKANNIGAITFLAAAKDLPHTDAAQFYLPLPKSLHPVCDPIVAIQAFYPAIAELSVRRGFDPDKPENLQKVTSTK